MADGDAPPPWWNGLDDDGKTYVQSSGLAHLEAGAAAAGLVKSYRELQKMHGGLAAGDVVKLPKADDPAGVKALYQRLGAPAELAGYKFDGLAFGDGTGLGEAFQDAARAAAHKVNMPAGMLKEFVAAMMPHMEAEEKAELAAAEAGKIEAAKALETEWGASAAKNKFLATNAMKTLGVSDETIAAVQSSPLGHSATMNLFLKLAEMMGEAKFVPGGGHIPGVLTKEQAQAQLDSLSADTAWVKRLLAGGLAEITQRRNLIAIIAGKPN